MTYIALENIFTFLPDMPAHMWHRDPQRQWKRQESCQLSRVLRAKTVHLRRSTLFFFFSSSFSPFSPPPPPPPGNIREEAMRRTQSMHMAHGTWLHYISWYYMFAGDQQQRPDHLLEHNSSGANGAAEAVACISRIGVAVAPSPACKCFIVSV